MSTMTGVHTCPHLLSFCTSYSLHAHAASLYTHWPHIHRPTDGHTQRPSETHADTQVIHTSRITRTQKIHTVDRKQAGGQIDTFSNTGTRNTDTQHTDTRVHPDPQVNTQTKARAHTHRTRPLAHSLPRRLPLPQDSASGRGRGWAAPGHPAGRTLWGHSPDRPR